MATPIEDTPAIEDIFGIRDRDNDGHRIYTAQDFQAIMNNLEFYLSVQEMKTLRLVCKGLNSKVNASAQFRLQVKGKFNQEAYMLANIWSIEILIKWISLELIEFSFFPKLTDFHKYMAYTGEQLTNLTLKNTSFDFDDFSTIFNFVPCLESLVMDGFCGNDLKPYPVAPIVEPFPTALRHIAFKNITVMGNSYLGYLINRSGYIKQLEIENCFAKKDPDEPTGFIIPSMLNRFDSFLPKMVALIMKNRGSLEKMAFRKNGNQSEMLGTIAKQAGEDTFNKLTEISLKFPKREFNPRTGVTRIAFNWLKFFLALPFTKSLGTVSKMELVFEGQTTQHFLREFIRPHYQHLNSLKLCLPITENPGLDLNFLQHIPHLESLDLNLQTTELSKIDRKQLANPKTPIQEKRAIFNRVQIPIETDFLHSLSNELTNISLAGIFRRENIFENGAALENFSNRTPNLTKFELIGPWNHFGQDHLLRMIIASFGNLRWLTLKNCGLMDKCLIQASPEVLQQVGQILLDPNSPNRPEDILPPNRTTIRRLTGLTYLDLSGNRGISDAVVYDLIRFNRLETLKLDCCDRISDVGLSYIGDHNPALQTIHLENVCTNVSNLGFNNLMNKCKRLKKLYTTKAVSHASNVVTNPNYDEIMMVIPEERIRVEDDKNAAGDIYVVYFAQFCEMVESFFSQMNQNLEKIYFKQN